MALRSTKTTSVIVSFWCRMTGRPPLGLDSSRGRGKSTKATSFVVCDVNIKAHMLFSWRWVPRASQCLILRGNRTTDAVYLQFKHKRCATLRGMYDIFAHAGHSHESAQSMNSIDHCTPIIIGAVVVIAILLAVVAYLLVSWQPKKTPKSTNKKPSKTRSN